MTQPAVNISELDGALGVLPPSSGRVYAVIGVSSQGPFDQPATFARVKDLRASFGDGPMVEAAAHYIDAYSKPVCVVRSGQSGTVTAADAVASTATGTAAVTVAASPAPIDDIDAALLIVTGGTRGTAGITYQLSYDGGKSWSPVTALGTATSIDLTEAGDVTLDIAAGTMVAGDVHRVRLRAKQWTTAELTAALTALGNSLVSWELVNIAGALDGDAIDALNAKFSAWHTIGKERAFVGNARVPNASETEAAYLAAISPLRAAHASVYGAIAAGACRLVSGVTGRVQRRPAGYVYGAREASVSAEVNVADVNLGALPGCSIRDDNGNPIEHDESINPGLDDAGFVTLRSWEGYGGVYVNRPRLFAAAGSDFEIMPRRRVINLAHEALRAYFVRRLSKPILVDRITGYILETERLEIQSGARKALAAVLLAKPMASDVTVSISKTDNLISTKTLTGSARITPLAYPETINLDVGYYNPALVAQAA